MTITDTIALLAFILSLYSAVLSTYTAINEFFRIKLTYLGTSYLTLSKSDVYVDEYGEHIPTYDKSSYSLAILVRIENKSKNPTTINEFVLNNKYVLNSHSSDQDYYFSTEFENKSDNIFSCGSVYIGNNYIKPLLQLEPLSSYEGYLVFDNLKEKPSHFDVKVKAIQKSKNFHLRFSLTSDCRNEIKPK